MDDDGESARMRGIVRAGYDEVSTRYRSNDGSSDPTTDESTAAYAQWVNELTEVEPPPARVLDLGCGAGVPAARLLVDAGYQVTGVDFSAAQVARARLLVPTATFVQADMVEVSFPKGCFDAVLSLYALIHLPRSDQPSVFAAVHRWLRPGGHLLAIVGSTDTAGIADYFGTDMFWDHPDSATSLGWLRAAGFTICGHRFIPEGMTGHTLVSATAE